MILKSVKIVWLNRNPVSTWNIASADPTRMPHYKTNAYTKCHKHHDAILHTTQFRFRSLFLFVAAAGPPALRRCRCGWPRGDRGRRRRHYRGGRGISVGIGVAVRQCPSRHRRAFHWLSVQKNAAAQRRYVRSLPLPGILRS